MSLFYTRGKAAGGLQIASFYTKVKAAGSLQIASFYTKVKAADGPKSRVAHI
jgi:hypothetical protein